MPPSYIRVRIVVWAYDRGQTEKHTGACDHKTFCVVYDVINLRQQIGGAPTNYRRRRRRNRRRLSQATITTSQFAFSADFRCEQFADNKSAIFAPLLDLQRLISIGLQLQGASPLIRGSAQAWSLPGQSLRDPRYRLTLAINSTVPRHFSQPSRPLE